MLRYLFYAFLIYLAYRLIFHFIIPIYKTTKQVKKQFREMSARMNSTDGYSRADDHHINQQQANQQTMPPGQEDKKAAAGDYIDFEEVK